MIEVDIDEIDITILKKLLENILCSDEYLMKLKKRLDSLLEGKKTKKEFKIFILDQRLSMLDDLVDAFVLYSQNLNSTKELRLKIRQTQNKENNHIENQLKQEILEKDTLLELVNEKIDIIFENIKQ